MSVISNRSYIDKLNCARIFCCAAFDDGYMVNEIISDIFKCYEEDAFIKFRDDIGIGQSSLGSNMPEKLAEMQMMVVIVSKHFLNQDPADGSMEDFHYALKHNIPILPISIEQGLEEQFNKKCGKFQLIFKYNENTYYNLLNESLRRLLVSAGIKNQVRTSFDGSIFLSYRRMDLEYAKAVMEKVHSFDICKSVGVWYDGALVPGYDYEEEIFEHINRCNCILMIVTSQLLEEGNFIMKEYPHARKKGIKIIPFVADDVDIVSLSKCYEGLFAEYPNGIRNYEELNSVLETIFIKKNEEMSIEQIYYIGLANLYGIDFEINTQRALAYILRAAENGYCEAYKKLVEIYEMGVGMEVNEELAIKYQSEYIKCLQRQSTEEKTAELTEYIIDEIYKLGDMLLKENNPEEARRRYLSVLDYYDMNTRGEKSYKHYLDISKVYENIGVLEGKIGNHDEALSNLLLAEKYTDEADRVATEANERKSITFIHALIAEKIALAYSNRKNLEMALRYSLIAAKPYEKIWGTEEMDNAKRKVLSRLYYEQGNIEMQIFLSEYENNQSDKDKLVEDLVYIMGIYRNAEEHCIDVDLLSNITNIEAYRNLTLIKEEIKNIYYRLFMLKPNSHYLSTYMYCLKEEMDIFMNVSMNDVAQNALKQKIRECIRMGEFLVKNRLNREAKKFYLLGYNGMKKLKLSSNSNDMKTICRIISQLSNK